MSGGPSGHDPEAAAALVSGGRTHMSDPLAGVTVAVLGFGNQGEAQALNLRDSGVAVIVGARAGGGSEARARAQGFEALPLAAAAARAGVCAVLLPDESTPALWSQIGPALRPHAGLVFAHGFNLLYADLAFPAAADVVLVSPTGPGRVLREVYTRGEGLPAYLAVHRDGSGNAAALAERYATALGCHRARLWPTTVTEETEVDLFGEQAVLCGGMNALVTAAFEVLVAKGYSPEIAYLECVHQLKYLADLLHERGVAGMRQGISGTALFGDLSRGPRVIGAASRAAMERLLDEIRSGAFAREWAAEVAQGRARLDGEVSRAARHPIEEARRRALGGGPGPGESPGESRKALSKN
jgi:ketol-acid reductoisomerase